jgi:hypothetical protein
MGKWAQRDGRDTPTQRRASWRPRARFSALSAVGALSLTAGCASTPPAATQVPWNPSSELVVPRPPDCHVVSPAQWVRVEFGEVPEMGTLSTLAAGCFSGCSTTPRGAAAAGGSID